MEYVLGIDVGGTTIKLGLFSAEGELLSEQKVKTPALDNEDGYQTVTDAIKLIVHGQKASRNDVIACGLDIPGPVADDGTVGLLANVDIDPEGLVQAITMCLPNATIAFVNDANAAALGEAWAGVAVGVPSFVLIALGTGVGAGVVVDGKLAAGAFGAGGEIGHIIVEPEETLTCGCGRHGCLEQYA
ncbi:MAG: ROK family protein, partial [Atopobium sp.]|nr:ROK family protein [Atopobium sp.]